MTSHWTGKARCNGAAAPVSSAAFPEPPSFHGRIHAKIEKYDCTVQPTPRCIQARSLHPVAGRRCRYADRSTPSQFDKSRPAYAAHRFRLSSPCVGQPAEPCLEHRIVSRHKAELSVKYSKVSANFFGCFLIAFVDKKIGAIVFPIPSLCHAVNVSDWSDPIGERAIMLSNYVSRITRAAPNVGPIIGCFLCPSDRHPRFVYVEKLCSNRGDQEFAPSWGIVSPGRGREHANYIGLQRQINDAVVFIEWTLHVKSEPWRPELTPELRVKAWSAG
jgi:hypothetical protein